MANSKSMISAFTNHCGIASGRSMVMGTRAYFAHIALMVAVCSFAGPAQSGGHAWSKRFGDASNQSVASVALDPAGYVVATGSFFGAIDLGGGPLSSAGQQDVYLAKFDSSGNHIWSRRFGDAVAQFARTVVIDGSGNVILTGSFNGSVNFGGTSLVSAGGLDIFVVKFDTNGGLVWSKRFGDANTQTGNDVALDSAGNLIATGAFSGSVDFGGGMLASAGQSDIYLVKFDVNGNHVWSKRFGDASVQTGSGLAVDGSGNVVATGSFNGTLDFGGAAMTSAGGSDIFLVKFDPGGGFVWNKRFGDATNQTGNDVAVDSAGNSTITGSFFGSVDFGAGALVGGGQQDVYLAHFSSAGMHLWSRAFGGSSDDFGNAVAVNASGNCILTGSFQGSVNFGGGPLTGAGGADVYVARYGPNGTNLSSSAYGDATTQSGSSIALSGAGDALVAGDFQGNIDLGGGPLTSAGGYDVLLAKFADAIFRDGF